MSTIQPFPSQRELAVPRGTPGSPKPSEVRFDWDALLDATKQLFPGTLEVRTEADPEYPDQEFKVIHVVAQGEVGSIVDREVEWVAILNRLAPGVAGIRLSIDPRP